MAPHFSVAVCAGLACRPLMGRRWTTRRHLRFEESPDTPTLSRFDERQRERSEMREQIVRRGVTDSRVLAAMRRPASSLYAARAQGVGYDDRPVSIGHRQTISQPYIVAYMTEALSLDPEARVLRSH